VAGRQEWQESAGWGARGGPEQIVGVG
jgi:hypothetical protein